MVTSGIPSDLGAVGSTTPVNPARARILISAFAVSPYRGSEPGMGWNICRRLARYHDVTVLYRRDNWRNYHRDIERYCQDQGPVAGLSLVPIDWPPGLDWVLRRGTPVLLYYAGYAVWQRAALQVGRKLHEQKPFDLAHQLNFIGYREPGYLWTLGIPFVWGPLGGAANLPWSYFPLLSWGGWLRYGFRNLANEAQKRLGLRCRKAARAARHIWVVGEDERRLVQGLWGLPCERLLETGTTPRPEAGIRHYDGHRPLRIAWSGLHIGRKALPILLHALSRLPRSPGVEVKILGEGSETKAWQSLARKLGVAGQIRWLGQLPQAEAEAEVSCMDVFVSTSLQEAASTVVLEALGQGMPVICHDACGMGIAVTDACGIKVPMHGPEASISGFAEAIRHLQAMPEEVARLSSGARERAEELAWDRKALQIAHTYDRVLSCGSGDRAQHR